MLAWAVRCAQGRRVWALEGTGSFAAGLVTVLADAGENIVEIQNNRRSRGAKNDRIGPLHRPAGLTWHHRFGRQLRGQVR
jgi:hypothetical protein